MPKKTLKGTIVSNKMKETVVVAFDILKKHPIYEKSIKRTRKFKAHSDMALNIGDMVEIEECKPFSKEVNWKVSKKLSEVKK
jgi:small subunit ribosomal protein S17